MTMSNSDARKRKAESDVDLPATPGYIARLVRERDAARAEVAALRERPMTADHGRAVLSEDEREALEVGAALFGWSTRDEAMASLVPVVESILASRMADALRDAANGWYGDERANGEHGHPLSAVAYLNHLADQYDGGKP